MVAFGHTAVGAGIGLLSYQLIGQTTPPVLGLVYTTGAGLISHYLIDFLPHGHFPEARNYKTSITIAFFFDFLLSVVVFSLAAYFSFGPSLKLLYILSGIIGAHLPDLLYNAMKLGFIPRLKILKAENNFHTGTHWHNLPGGKPLIIGARDIWQIAVVALVLLLILKH